MFLLGQRLLPVPFSALITHRLLHANAWCCLEEESVLSFPTTTFCFLWWTSRAWRLKQPSAGAKCRGSATVWLMVFFPAGRVELQKERLGVLYCLATRVNLCPVHLPGKSPISRLHRGGFLLECLKHFKRVISHGLGSGPWDQ